MFLGPDWIAGSQGWGLCTSLHVGAIMKNYFKRMSPHTPGWLSKSPQRASPYSCWVSVCNFPWGVTHEEPFCPPPGATHWTGSPPTLPCSMQTAGAGQEAAVVDLTSGRRGAGGSNMGCVRGKRSMQRAGPSQLHLRPEWKGGAPLGPEATELLLRSWLLSQK